MNTWVKKVWAVGGGGEEGQGWDLWIWLLAISGRLSAVSVERQRWRIGVTRGREWQHMQTDPLISIDRNCERETRQGQLVEWR